MSSYTITITCHNCGNPWTQDLAQVGREKIVIFMGAGAPVTLRLECPNCHKESMVRDIPQSELPPHLRQS